ncbi:MAG TPA: hypothetical protein VGJ26_08080, partial [Pirellulales bacterium]
MLSRRALFWITFLFLCGLLGGLKNWQNVRIRIAQLRHQAEVQELQARNMQEYRQALDEMMELLSKGDNRGPAHPGWTKEELEANLPGNPRLQFAVDSKRPGGKTALWNHPSAPIDAHFNFNAEGRLNGWELSKAPPRTQPTPASKGTLTDSGEQLRWGVAKYGKWLWPVMLLAWVVARPFRRTIGDLLLAIAIACAVADIVSP